MYCKRKNAERAAAGIAVLVIRCIVMVIAVGGRGRGRGQGGSARAGCWRPAPGVPAEAYYVISLDTAEGRRRMARMRRSILAPWVTRIPGAHGVKLQPGAYAGVVERRWDAGVPGGPPQPRLMSLGEVGCCLSHRKAWQALVDSGARAAMVLEDDALHFAPGFFDKVRLVAQHVPSDWGILLLGFWLKNGPSGHAVNAHVHRVHDFCLTHAYLITRAAALELLARTPVDAPLDTWLSRQSYDIPIYRHTYELRPTDHVNLPLASRLEVQDYDESDRHSTDLLTGKTF